jgi:hypothetical protein
MNKEPGVKGTAGLLIRSKPSALTKSLVPLDKQMKVSEEPLDDTVGRIWLLSAMKGSGKTTIWYNVLHNKASPWHNLFDKIWMISPTAKGDDKLKPLIDELQESGQYWDHLSEKVMLEVYDCIATFNHDFKTEREPQTLQEKRLGIIPPLKHTRKPRNLLIFDDCMADMPSSTQKSVVNRIFTTSRHFLTNVIVTTQKYSKLNTTIRANADYISVWKSNSKHEVETLEDDINVKKDIFEKAYKYATDEPYSFLHITFNAGHPNLFKKFDRILL